MWIVDKKPKFIGLLTGAVAGLVAITPAAGYVSISGAIIIGILAGVVCFLAVTLKNRLKLDDALDVWGVHGVGGVLGCIATGLFATTVWNPAGANGLLAGGTTFFLYETLSVLLTAAYAFGFSYLALWLIDKVVKVKVTKEEEQEGLDEAIHGETAYEAI